MKINYIIALALLLLTITGCGTQTITGKTVREEVIEIGFIGPLTGFGGEAGQGIQKGALLALKELNTNGGINGKELKIIFEDGQCMPKPAVTAAQKLIVVDKVPVIIGPGCSTSILPVSPLANEHRVPIVGTIDASEDIANAGEFVFTNGFSIESAAKLMAEFAFNELNIVNVTVMFDQDDWAIGLATTFQQEFEELGGNVLLVVEHDPSSTDYRTELLKMDKQNPEAMFILDLDFAGSVFNQAKELGINTQFLGADNIGFGIVLETATEAVEGSFFTFQMAYDDTNEAMNELIQKHVAEFGEAPLNPLYPAMGYDNVMLIAEVMEEHGTEPEQIQQGLLQTKNFQGIIGNSTFDERGVVNRKQFINTVKDGKFQAVN